MTEGAVQIMIYLPAMVFVVMVLILWRLADIRIEQRAVAHELAEYNRALAEFNDAGNRAGSVLGDAQTKRVYACNAPAVGMIPARVALDLAQDLEDLARGAIDATSARRVTRELRHLTRRFSLATTAPCPFAGVAHEIARPHPGSWTCPLCGAQHSDSTRIGGATVGLFEAGVPALESVGVGVARRAVA